MTYYLARTCITVTGALYALEASGKHIGETSLVKIAGALGLSMVIILGIFLEPSYS